MPNSSSVPPKNHPTREVTVDNPLGRSASLASPSVSGWALTIPLILVSGLLFYWLRGPLDRHWPKLDRPEAPISPASPTAEPQRFEEPQELAEPVWTFEEMESALLPLPDLTAALISAGHEEIPRFEDLESSDEALRLRARSQWESWGRIWRNRIRAIRDQMPPAGQCSRHAALEPTCAVLIATFRQLAQVPLASSVEEAEMHLLSATEALFPSPEEEEEATDGGDEG